MIHAPYAGHGGRGNLAASSCNEFGSHPKEVVASEIQDCQAENGHVRHGQQIIRLTSRNIQTFLFIPVSLNAEDPPRVNRQQGLFSFVGGFISCLEEWSVEA